MVLLKLIKHETLDIENNYLKFEQQIDAILDLKRCLQNRSNTILYLKKYECH